MVAVAPDSMIYVLSDGANVGVYDPHTGIRQNMFFAGDGSADANIPMAFTVDANGTLLIALHKLVDTGTDVIDEYRLRRVQPGGRGATETLLPYPCTAIGVDLSGLVYVAFSGPPDFNQDFLKVYDASGSEKLSQVIHSPHLIDIVGVAADPE